MPKPTQTEIDNELLALTDVLREVSKNGNTASSSERAAYICVQLAVLSKDRPHTYYRGTISDYAYQAHVWMEKGGATPSSVWLTLIKCNL